MVYLFFTENGAVHASFFNEISTDTTLETLPNDPRFPHNPTVSGFLDNLDTPEYYSSEYALRIWTYLVAPRTGDYVFYVAGGDKMQVSLSTDSSEANKKVIITRNGWTSRYQYDG